MTERAIDLNADVGEHPAALSSGAETALIAQITSANVACGGHAGDEATMRAVVELCVAHGVAIGAHPSFPDRANFGRVDMTMRSDELEASVFAQISALGAIVRAHGVELTHVKPHGALYHAASESLNVAIAVARAVRRWSRDVFVVGQAGSAALQRWRAAGLTPIAEAFADRRYERDGKLRARGLAGAVLTDPGQVAAQALRLAQGLGAVTDDGTVIAITADTLCLHGDTPGAATLAQHTRAALLHAGLSIRAPRRATT